MNKFILGILLGVLIAGAAFFVLKQNDEVNVSSSVNTSALNKIRNQQQTKQYNLQEGLSQAADKLRNSKSPYQMLSAVDEMIKLRPQDANLYALKAQILQQQGNFAAALEAIDKAIALEPQNAAYYQLRAENAFALRDYKSAERDFSFSAQLSGKADNYYNRAITNLNLGNYQAAKQDFKKAQDLYKKEGNLGAFNQTKGISNMLQKIMPVQSSQNTNSKKATNNISAKKQAEKTAEVTSKISQSLKHFSQSDAFKSQFKDFLPDTDEPLKDLQDLPNQNIQAPKITKKDVIKDTPLESIEKAKKLISQKDFDGAKSVLDKAIADNPNNDSLYQNRAQANYQQGNYQAAFNDLNKALELNPKNYQAALSKGDMLQGFGQTGQAKKAYQNAAQIAEENGNQKAAEEAKARYQLIEGKEITAKTNQRLTQAANAYYKKDYDTAANIFRQIYEENPTAENAFNLGLAYNGQGKVKEANQMFTAAADQKPQDLNAQMLAAQSAVQLEDFQTAQKYLEHIKKIDDTNPDAWALSAQINSANGDMDSTKRDLQNALIGYKTKLQEVQDDSEKQRIESQMQEIQNYLNQTEQAGN